MTKLEAAVVEMIKAIDRVNGLSREIGKAIDDSNSAQNTDGKQWLPPTNWLSLAYEMEPDPDGGPGARHHSNHENDVEGYLADNCQHALRAHHLIQERKAAKKALGIAKRRVTVMGRQLANTASMEG